jgi:hypothetical protein
VNKYLLTFDSFSVVPSSETGGTIYLTGTCDAPNGVCDTAAICLYLTEKIYTDLAAELVPAPCKRTCLDCVITSTKKRSSNQANLNVEVSVKKAYEGDGKLIVAPVAGPVMMGSMLFNFFSHFSHLHFLLTSLFSSLYSSFHFLSNFLFI